MMVLSGLLVCFLGLMYRFRPVFVLINMKKTFCWAFTLFGPLFLAATAQADGLRPVHIDALNPQPSR